MSNAALIDELVTFYGSDALVPSRQQWQALVESDHAGSICMINFITFNEVADYQDGTKATGLEAMMAYSEVSQKMVAKVGGQFIAQGLMGSVVIGDDDQWDSIGMVRYPTRQAFIDLFSDPEYRQGHFHRIAACKKHRMVMLLDFNL